MSKQADAKIAQGYRPKPVHPMCSNCRHFNSDTVRKPGWGDSWYEEEKNLRCGIGEFKVMKMGICNDHDWIEKS